MIELIKKIIPEKYHNSKVISKINFFLRDTYKNASYSQEGEDMILNRLFEAHKKGFYIDVGAHHPKRFSNTHIFHKRGWRGINIDAMPGSMKIFNKKRPKDINIEAVISNNENEINYYSFKEPALNTIDEETASMLIEVKKIELIDVIKIRTKSLANLLDAYLPKNQQIDFMTIDVEGVDFEVLKSNNWNKYRPSYILVEIRKNNIEELINHEITQYLKGVNYILFAKSLNTIFFKLQK